MTTGVAALSCPAAGDCTAIGTYLPDGGTTSNPRAFTLDESNSTWGTPRPLTGLDALLSATGSSFSVQSLSCAAPGDCTAGGRVSDGTSGEPFLASESDGTWGDAQAVPGFQSLPGSADGIVSSVSCPGNGDCAAVGIYSTATSSFPFAIDEAGGTWGPAHPLSLPAGARMEAVPRVACWGPGNCTAVGGLATTKNLAFAATESRGAWGTGQPFSGIPATATSSWATALSCAPAGECTIVGWYAAASIGLPFRAFTVTSNASGSIGTAQPLPVAYGHNRSTAALSCPQPGYCAMTVNGPSVSLVSEATAATVTLKASAPTITYGNEQSETLTATVSSPAGGTPTGTVTVTGDTAGACVITLQNGTGTCTLTATALPGGPDTLTATYNGDASYVSATSAAKVTVAGAPVTASFTFSPATATYTSKNLTFTINVTSAAGIPAGWAGGVIGPYNAASGTCPAALAAGKVTCTATVPPTAGRYPVVAQYGGSANFLGATSATQYLTITRAKTSATLSLSRATITYGSENGEKLTVSVSHLSGSYATGKVTIKAGTTVICTISLSKGGGSCILSPKKLRAGTYRLSATYSGDTNYFPSTSAIRVLKVAA